MKLTFLGAARTVTGSKHLLDTAPRRVLVDCGLFQGLKELRERNWRDLPIKPVGDRRGRADARAPRSLRLPAAPGRAGIPRPHLLHARARRICAASCCPTRAASRKKTRRTPTASVLEAHAGAAALHRGRRLPRALAAPAGRLRPAGAGRRRRRGRVHQRRPSARVGVRADPRGRQDDPLRRRSRPLRAPRAARSDDGRRSRLPARRVDLRQSRARAGRRRREAGAGDQGDGASAAAR